MHLSCYQEIGKIDANTEFPTVQTAADFLKPSMGYSPTITFHSRHIQNRNSDSTPSYTYPRTTVRVWDCLKRPAPENYRSSNPAVLGYWEPRNLVISAPDIGIWVAASPAMMAASAGTNGFYSVLEQNLWNASDDKNQRKVSALLLGVADGRIRPFVHHLGSEAVGQGIVKMRPQAAIGVAATWVRFSTNLRPASTYRTS